MANLSVEEPDALMCARPGLWEPRAGNGPGPPGPKREAGLRLDVRRRTPRRKLKTQNNHSPVPRLTRLQLRLEAETKTNEMARLRS